MRDTLDKSSIPDTLSNTAGVTESNTRVTESNNERLENNKIREKAEKTLYNLKDNPKELLDYQSELIAYMNGDSLNWKVYRESEDIMNSIKENKLNLLNKFTSELRSIENDKNNNRVKPNDDRGYTEEDIIEYKEEQKKILEKQIDYIKSF